MCGYCVGLQAIGYVTVGSKETPDLGLTVDLKVCLNVGDNIMQEIDAECFDSTALQNLIIVAQVLLSDTDTHRRDF